MMMKRREEGGWSIGLDSTSSRPRWGLFRAGYMRGVLEHDYEGARNKDKNMNKNGEKLRTRAVDMQNHTHPDLVGVWSGTRAPFVWEPKTRRQILRSRKMRNELGLLIRRTLHGRAGQQ
jgi:hypothetical protein